MTWLVTGAWDSSGTDDQIEVEARNETHAEQIARQRGLLVTNVAARFAPIPEHKSAAKELGKSTISTASPVAQASMNAGGMTFGEGGARLFFIVAGILLMSSALGAGISTYHIDRFHDDNAYGASANALERLIDIQREVAEITSATGRGICGAIAWVLASLIKTRATIRDSRYPMISEMKS